MSNPSEPLRATKRELLALYLANGYGPSAAYSSAGYSFKNREHLSKLAGTKCAAPDLIARVKPCNTGVVHTWHHTYKRPFFRMLM